jgi:hypothetical protein
MADDALICMVEIPMRSRNTYEFEPSLWEIAEAQERFRAHGPTS